MKKLVCIRMSGLFSGGDASQKDRLIISLINPESAYAARIKKVITDSTLCHLEHLEGNLCCHSNLSPLPEYLPPISRL